MVCIFPPSVTFLMYNRSSLIYLKKLSNIFMKYSIKPPLNSYSSMLYPVCFYVHIFCLLLIISFFFLALSIILEISYLVWSKSRNKPGHVLDFCVEYYFKSSIPQDVDKQLRCVPRSKNKWRIFQKKSCMCLVFIFYL